MAVLKRLAGVVAYARVFSDVSSIQSFRKLMNQPASCGPDIVPLRLRSIHGNPIFCRPRTTDADVVFDTFFQRYHLPPLNLGRVSTILDLGSNIGTTMAHYAALYPQAKILGVELDADNAELCRRNVKCYSDRCQVICGAVWKQDGRVAYSGRREWGYRITQDATGIVPAYSMSCLLNRMGGEVDFVKMDIEGAEAEILRHPDDWIRRVRSLKIEVREPYTLAECMLTLENYGFDCRRDIRHHAGVFAMRRDKMQ